jgi:hypothetical protein
MNLRAAALVVALGGGVVTGALAQDQAQPQQQAPQQAPQQQTPAEPTEPPQMGAPSTPVAPLKEGGLTAETVTLATRPALVYAGQADWDDSEKALSSAINLLYATVAKFKLEAAGSPMVEYLEDDDDQLRFMAYLPIQPGARGTYGKEVKLGDTPAGTVLKYTHQGSYEDLEDVYSQIEDQLTAQKKEMKRVVEEYVSDPQSTSPDQMVTNIYVFTE